MRLIDADKVKELIRGSLSVDTDADKEYVCGLIDEISSSWISVKDRLPKSMANKVIVWLEHEDYVGYIGFGHYEKYKGVEMWYDLEHNEQFAKRGYTVTHWMPLPEPPKEGEA